LKAPGDAGRECTPIAAPRPDQPNAEANFGRRWVLFENGKVMAVINDFWVD
jgi:hypothetical protein